MKIVINLKIGRLVKYFILSDLILLSGWGLIEPIFSVFIIKNIAGATLTSIGMAAAVYWILKAFLQIPIADFIDKQKGEKDDFYVLIIGIFTASITAFGFIFATQIWHIYVLQALHALAFAMYAASWVGIFSRHLDKDRPAFDWSLDSTAIALGSGISGFFGSIIANKFGFAAVFALAFILSFVAGLVLFFVPSLVLPQKTIPEDGQIIDHKPTINVGQ